MIKLNFWQMAVARVTALLIGIAVGSHWHEIFASYILQVAAAGVVGSLYVLYLVVLHNKS
jgi:hypothetical protein